MQLRPAARRLRLSFVACLLGYSVLVATACGEDAPAASVDDVSPEDSGAAEVQVAADVFDVGPDLAPDIAPDLAPDIAPDLAPDLPPDVGIVGCPGEGEVEELTFGPYVQVVTQTSAWILWETLGGTESRVDWGPDEALGELSCGATVPLELKVNDTVIEVDSPTTVHEVQLVGLEPATHYYYRVRTGAHESAVHRFATPPSREAETSTRFVAMSDAQRSDSWPDKLREVVEDGVMGFFAAAFEGELPDELSFALMAGDLVDNGWDELQWPETFFGPSAALMAQIPLYPVTGNHEANAPHYWRYFRLPDNGTPGFEEHWYSVDRSNLRIIGLDSNAAYHSSKQLEWLDAVLADACADDLIDFVFAQLHHPHKSELWLDGETEWVGEVIARMETFSTDCGKPSVHLFGHTHGYSRGQSRDHAHLWMNVGTAGGGIDQWAAEGQADYVEFSRSLPEWGFVLVESEAGDTPNVRIRRISRGDAENPLDNDVTDEITIRRYNQSPATPTSVATEGLDGCESPVTLVASDFDDPDDDPHWAAHWQVSALCEDFSSPLYDEWRQLENWYGGEDTLAGDALWDQEVAGLEGDLALCWRVRYRDDNLSWSDWSVPEAFVTPPCL